MTTKPREETDAHVEVEVGVKSLRNDDVRDISRKRLTLQHENDKTIVHYVQTQHEQSSIEIFESC